MAERLTSELTSLWRSRGELRQHVSASVPPAPQPHRQLGGFRISENFSPVVTCLKSINFVDPDWTISGGGEIIERGEKQAYRLEERVGKRGERGLSDNKKGENHTEATETEARENEIQRRARFLL